MSAREYSFRRALSVLIRDAGMRRARPEPATECGFILTETQNSGPARIRADATAIRQSFGSHAAQSDRLPKIQTVKRRAFVPAGPKALRWKAAIARTNPSI